MSGRPGIASTPVGKAEPSSLAAKALRELREQGALRALRHAVRRLLAPACEEGALLFFVRELGDRPLGAEGINGAVVREATAADLDRLLEGGDPHRSEGALRERFRRGDRCFAVFEDSGEVLHSRWLTSDAPNLPELGRSLILAPGTAYFYDGFTRPAARGRGLDGLARRAIFAALAAEGYERALSYVRADNPVGIRAAQRCQVEIARIRYLRLGARIFTFESSCALGGAGELGPRTRYDEDERSARASRWQAWFESWLEQAPEKRSTGFGALPEDYFAAIAGFVANTLQLSPEHDSVLDVGCDSAMVSRRVAARCRRLTGVDLVPALLWNTPPVPPEIAARAPDTMAASDARRLPFRSGAFDKVYCLSMIHTLPSRADAYRVVAELIRVCSPGGQILVGGVPDQARRWRARAEVWRRGGWRERLEVAASLLLPGPVKSRLRSVLRRGEPDLVALDFDFSELGDRLSRQAVEWRVVPFGEDFWSRDFRITRSNLLISVPPARHVETGVEDSPSSARYSDYPAPGRGASGRREAAAPMGVAASTGIPPRSAV